MLLLDGINDFPFCWKAPETPRRTPVDPQTPLWEPLVCKMSQNCKMCSVTFSNFLFCPTSWTTLLNKYHIREINAVFLFTFEKLEPGNSWTNWITNCFCTTLQKTHQKHNNMLHNKQHSGVWWNVFQFKPVASIFEKAHTARCKQCELQPQSKQNLFQKHIAQLLSRTPCFTLYSLLFGCLAFIRMVSESDSSFPKQDINWLWPLSFKKYKMQYKDP